MTEKIRVVIADDQSLITQSFKVLLETVAQDIQVVGTAKDGKEAAALVAREKPGVVLMDVRMPVMDGVQAVDAIHRTHPDVKIIMLTTFDDDTYVHEAIRSGAVGYLLKDISTDELISSIRAVMHGAVLVSSTVAQKLFQKDGGSGGGAAAGASAASTPQGAGADPSRDAEPPRSPENPDPEMLAILKELSRKEIQILRLLVLGLENKEIAEKLYAAEQTVKNTVSVIYTKLGIENRREARRFALRAGLVQPGDILRNT